MSVAATTSASSSTAATATSNVLSLDTLLTMPMKKLKDMHKRALINSNPDQARIALLQKAIEIRHARHNSATGEGVASASENAAATALGNVAVTAGAAKDDRKAQKSLDKAHGAAATIQHHKADGKDDSKAKKAGKKEDGSDLDGILSLFKPMLNVAGAAFKAGAAKTDLPLCTSATTIKFHSDAEFALQVFKLALDDTISPQNLKDLENTDAENIELYRAARGQHLPFPQPVPMAGKMTRTSVELYKRTIEQFLTIPVHLLQLQQKICRQVGNAPGAALHQIAIDIKSGK